MIKPWGKMEENAGERGTGNGEGMGGMVVRTNYKQC